MLLAEREIARLAEVARPRRIARWQVAHGVVALLLLAWAVLCAVASAWLGMVLTLLWSGVFGSSALLAPRRLARRLERARLARDRNATVAHPGQEPRSGV